jgi:hypothetical protein
MIRLLVCVAIAFVFSGWSSDGVAQEKQFKSSLEFVPQAASFYYASMNHEQLWSSLTNSRALKQLQDSPINKKLRSAYRKRAQGFDRMGDNVFRYYLEGYANSIDSIVGKSVFPYLEKLVKHECFFYANEDWSKFLSELTAITQETQKLVDASGGIESATADPNAFLKILATRLENVQVPTVVAGALVDDPEDFSSLIDVAEAGLTPLLNDLPPEMRFLAEGFESEKQNGWRYISFVFKGTDIPWEQMAQEVSEEDRAAFEAMRDLVSKKSFAASLSVKQNLLTFSIGPSNEHLQNLGKNPLLIDHPLMKPVKDAKVAGKTLTSVSYVSEATIAASIENSLNTIASIPFSIQAGLASVPAETMSPAEREELNKSVQQDISELLVDLRSYFGKPGATVGYSFQSAAGIEGFLFNHSENKFADASVPLRLTKHLGQNPTMFLLSREKQGHLKYEMLRKHCGKLFAYLQKYAPQIMDDMEEVKSFTEAMARLSPILQKLDSVTSEKFIPNASAGESGLVMSLANEKKSLGFTEASDQSLPLPAFAIIADIRNPEIVKQALEEYYEIAKELFHAHRDLNEDEVFKTLEFPELQRKSIGDAEMFYLPLAEEFGDDAWLMPHVLVGRDLLVFGTMEEQSAKMMVETTTPFFGPAGEAGPGFGALYFDHRQMVDGLQHWISFGFQQFLKSDGKLELASNGEIKDLEMTESDIRETTTRFLRFLGCFEGYSSRSYMDNQVQVNHYLWKFTDLTGE